MTGRSYAKEGRDMIEPVIEEIRETGAIIKVVGVGGGGVNAINTMIASGVRGVEFIAMNTDVQHLQGCLAETTVELIGPTRGRGAGGDPERGREAALQKRQVIEDLLRGADMVVVTAVFGGGTGTGAATAVAEVAKSLGILTVAVVTLPFRREGEAKMRDARKWLDTLKSHVDAYAEIHNDNLKKLVPRGTPTRQMLQMLDQFLVDTLTGLVELIVHRAYINRDLEDLRAVLTDCGRFLIGIGMGEGENRAEDAITMALRNPLLEGTDVDGARAALINVVQGPDGSDDEVDVVMNKVWEHLASDARVWYGWDEDPRMEGRMKVTIIVSHLPDVGDVDVSRLIEVEEAASRVMSRDVSGPSQYPGRPVLTDQAGLDRGRAQRGPSRPFLNEARLPAGFDDGPSELDPVPAFMRARPGEARLTEALAPSEVRGYSLPGVPRSGHKV